MTHRRYGLSSTLYFFAAVSIRFQAARRSASVTPCTWLKRAAALRTCDAFSRGSLRCLGNAYLVAGIRSRAASFSFAMPSPPACFDAGGVHVVGGQCVLFEAE